MPATPPELVQRALPLFVDDALERSDVEETSGAHCLDCAKSSSSLGCRDTVGTSVNRFADECADRCPTAPRLELKATPLRTTHEHLQPLGEHTHSLHIWLSRADYAMADSNPRRARD